MQCPACDQTIRVGSRLCPYCGTWLVEGADLPFPPAAAPTAARPPAPAYPPAAPPAPSHAAPAHAAAPSFPATGPTPARIIVPPPSDLASYGPPAPTQRVEQPAPFSEQPVRAAAEEFDDVTTLSARRKKPTYWTLTLPNGTVELVTDRVVIGRHPEYMPALPTARLIPVADPSRSVSKNHACFSLYGSKLVVEDLGSTNGIIVTRPDGHEHDIGVGGRVELEDGAKVELGDVIIYIGRV